MLNFRKHVVKLLTKNVAQKLPTRIVLIKTMNLRPSIISTTPYPIHNHNSLFLNYNHDPISFNYNPYTPFISMTLTPGPIHDANDPLFLIHNHDAHSVYHFNSIPMFFLFVFSQGIGVAMVLISWLISIYYNVVIAWSFFYLYESLTDQLPWATCGNKWNTPQCRLA